MRRTDSRIPPNAAISPNLETRRDSIFFLILELVIPPIPTCCFVLKIDIPYSRDLTCMPVYFSNSLWGARVFESAHVLESARVIFEKPIRENASYGLVATRGAS